MKKNLLFSLICFFILGNLSAQTEINFTIHHKLGASDFELFTAESNNLTHQFDVKRLEYYISQISLVHDGAQETAIEDIYMLVDASEATSIPLGSYDITNLEAVRFYIGVDSVANHSDPASYDANHPLAPQFPSMHWGWASGYRFVAMEGSCGTNLNLQYQLHGLGDMNYHMTEVPVTLTAENGSLNIELDADYIRSLENIELSSGVFDHGFDNDAALIIENFRDYVFSASGTTTSLSEFDHISIFEVYPNPTDQNTRVQLELKETGPVQLILRSYLGHVLRTYEVADQQTQIDLSFDHAGVYFLQVTRNGQHISTRKLFVTN